MVKTTPTKSRAPFYGVLLLFGVAGAVGIWYSIKANTQKPITLDATAMATLPKAEGYLRGDPNAPVTIMEFADFECPGCGQFAALEEPEIRARIIDAGLANFRYFDFPLPIHTNTLAASLAASCAADQNKFWEMHDAIFAGQDQWNGQATGNPRKVLDGYAETLGMDMKAYGECYSSQRNLPRIQANKAAGDARGVNSTPTIVIGDRVYPGGVRFDGLKKIVDSIIAAQPKKAATTDTAKK
ncbi:MAG: thioredoxin domain-containing protein [Gemmatimonadaceae bacterium]|nr:thioredoxin domain-containing protein [Gemmatimonadaceae bacterium]